MKWCEGRMSQAGHGTTQVCLSHSNECSVKQAVPAGLSTHNLQSNAIKAASRRPNLSTHL